MVEWRHIFKNLLPGILALLSVVAGAQELRLERAQQLLRAQKFEEAARSIDSAVADPQTSHDFIAWTTRAYVYYQIYNQTDIYKLESGLRDTILISVRKSITLNPDSDYVSNNYKMLNKLSSHYWNIAKRLLMDSVNADRSLIAYTRYRELQKLADANVNLDAREVEYFNAVGSQFSEQFNKNNADIKAQTTAKVALMKVLDLQPDNPSANMNMGLLFLNQAVNIVRDLEWETDLSKLDETQRTVENLARQAEKFILKVYMQDNKNRKACTALFYIYRILYDIPKSNEFRKRAEDLGENFEVEENKNQSQQK